MSSDLASQKMKLKESDYADELFARTHVRTFGSLFRSCVIQLLRPRAMRSALSKDLRTSNQINFSVA